MESKSKIRIAYNSKKLSQEFDLTEGLGKIPPQAVDIEEAVLGAILLEKNAIHEVTGIIKPESFYKDANQEIYIAVLELLKDGSPIDILTVTAQLRKTGKLEFVGGAYYISELTSKVSSSANIETHARIIAEKHIKRNLISIASNIHRDAYEDTTDVFDLLNKTELALTKTGIEMIKKGARNVSEISDNVFEQYYQRCKSAESGITGVPTGLIELDKITSGWQSPDLIIVAARPGMGKTAFIGKCARNAARHGVSTLIFSLEMSGEQLVTRMAAAEGQVDSIKILKGKIPEYEMEMFHKAKSKIEKMPIYIDDTPGISITEFRGEAIRMKREKDIGLIIFDYIQLADGQSEFREQEISKISRALKKLAKELNVPVIALSQLSRAVETRGGEKKPQLSDLRESGAIEQDADLVIFLYRPEYYGILNDAAGNSLTGVCIVIIAKHRNGALDEVELSFISKFTDFDNLTYEPPPFNHEKFNDLPKVKPFPDVDGLRNFTEPKITDHDEDLPY